MGFRFRYEALLSYRTHLKEQAEIGLAGAQRRLGEAKEALASAHRDLQELNQLLEKRLQARISSDELRNYHDYMEGLKTKMTHLTHLVAEREVAVRKKREDLLAKAKAHKVMEKLKEKDFEKWVQEQSQMEQRQMNEVAVVRYGREFL